MKKLRFVVLISITALSIITCGSIDKEINSSDIVSNPLTEVIEETTKETTEKATKETVTANYILFNNLNLDNKNNFHDKAEVFYYDTDLEEEQLPYSILQITLSDGKVFTKKYEGYFDNYLYHSDLNGDGKEEIIFFTQYRSNFPHGTIYIYGISEGQLVEWSSVSQLNEKSDYVHYDIMEDQTIAEMELLTGEQGNILRIFYYDLNQQLPQGFLYTDLQWNGTCWDVIQQGISYSDKSTEVLLRESISERVNPSSYSHREGFDLPHLNFEYSKEQMLDKVYFYNGKRLATAREAAYLAAQSLYDIYGIRLDNYFVIIQNYGFSGNWDISFYHSLVDGNLTSVLYDVSVNGEDGSCNCFNIYFSDINKEEIIVPENLDEMSVQDMLLYYYNLFPFKEHPKIEKIERESSQSYDFYYKLILKDGTYYRIELDEDLKLPRFAYGIYSDHRN